jgi:hypothetical protein
MGRRRKRNAGWFKKGHDPRRHELTTAERKRGYETAMNLNDWQTLAYVYRKVRGYYRARNGGGV